VDAFAAASREKAAAAAAQQAEITAALSKELADAKALKEVGSKLELAGAHGV
jgi:hypothetical protein